MRLSASVSASTSLSGCNPSTKNETKYRAAAPATTAWTSMCSGSAGLCQKLRPLHCAKRNAV